GSITVPVTDRIELSGELRYTYEIEEFRGGFISEPGASPVALNDQDRSESFDFLTGRLSASVQINKDIKSYVTVARGAKAGGFSFLDTDLALIPGLSVDELETAETTTYEVGLRGSLLSDRLRFGAAAFFNDTSDEQLAAFDFATFTAGIENADTETYGVEVDLTTEPVEGLVLRGALGLLETEITDAPVETGAEVGGEVPNAPEVALSISADYTIPLDAPGLSVDLAFGAEYQHVGSQIADIGNTRSLDSYDVVNLRLRLIGDDYEVFAFGENVFDETYATGAFPFGVSPAGEQVSTGGVGQPRLFGLGVRLTF
ncbi:MAG: TonB-dependent receptor, partial [Pseudomonadota bacterium]